MKCHQQHNLVSRESNVDLPSGLVDELDFDVEKELLALIVPLGFIIISSEGKEYVYRWGVVYRTFNTNVLDLEHCRWGMTLVGCVK